MNSVFKIGERWIGYSDRPFLIAEIACAHEGDFEECCFLIESASEVGADAIQLQVFRSHHQVQARHPIYPLLKKLEFNDEEWEKLFEKANGTGCAISVFVYDEPSLELVEPWSPDLLKLNSADLNYHPMLARAAKSGIPISLGTGASTVEEIQIGINILQSEGSDNCFLMHGVQDFPTQISDARLTRIGLLKKLWGLPTGYADHTEGDDLLSPWMDLVALGQGASVLEKHITRNRAEKKTDYQASLSPEQWRNYAENIRRAAASLSPELPVNLSEADIRYRKFQKKIAFARHDIKADSVLKLQDFVFMRSDGSLGLSHHQIEKLVGQKAPVDLHEGDIVPASWM